MRILRWNTLLGRRLAGDSIAPLMLGVVCIGCVALSLSGTVVDYSLDHPEWIERVAHTLDDPVHLTQVFVHALLGWTAAIVAFIIAAFALAHAPPGVDREEGNDRGRHAPEALVLVSALPIVALFEILHGADWFFADSSDQSRIWTWLLARIGLGSVLVASGLVAVLHRRRLNRLVPAAAAGAGLVVLALAFTLDPAQAPAMIHDDAFLVRPWELVPLAIFATGGFFVFAQLHRQRPTVLSHALMLSMFPQAFAQVEAALSIHPEDGHSIVAHLDSLLAMATLLAGVLFDYVHTQRSRESAVQEFESAQLELRTKTRELVRVDRELVDQDLKRRQAERTLAILEKAVETMSLGVTVTDPAGKILYTNPADARMHGYTVEQLLGESSSIYSPRGLPTPEESDSVFLHPWTRERINTTRDDRNFPVRLVSDLVRDAEDRPMALVTICEDISERKRIELALERRDRILEAVGLAAERFLAESSWEASVEEVLESLKRATQVDKVRLVRIEDLKPHDLDDTWNVLDESRDTTTAPLELPSGDIFPRWERELRRGRLLRGKVCDLPDDERQALEKRGVSSFVIVPIFVIEDWLGYLSFDDRDEEREWLPAELEVLRTAARTFGAAMLRKQAEMALAASQARYQDLLENASDLVQSVSPEGRFQFVNRAWKQALGYTHDEVGRLTLWDVIHPDHHKSFAKALSNILEVGRVEERLEVVFVAKNSQQIYLEGSLNARFIAGEPVAVRGIFRDITERRIVDRMKKEFLSTVSHELRTPLTSIIASLGLLQSGRLADDGERTAELVAVAHRNSNRLLQLINDVLDLQKLVAGKVVYRLQPIGVKALLQEARRGIQALADSLSIDLRLDAVEENLEVLADRDRLIQVLNNLLSNAIKFSTRGDRVILSAHEESGKVVISVTDHGPGIPEEFQARLFERFTQVDSSATRSAGGSGLGLSIVEGLVEGMNGRVSFDTEVGRGTTFYVELPEA